MQSPDLQTEPLRMRPRSLPKLNSLPDLADEPLEDDEETEPID